MKLYFVTEQLAGTGIWPAQRGWYVQDDDGRLYGPGLTTEDATRIWSEQTGKKPEPKS